VTSADDDLGTSAPPSPGLDAISYRFRSGP